MEQVNIKKVNKFSPRWQLVRVQVKKSPKIEDKIKKVLSYLSANKNLHDKQRVLNWLRMTKLGYSKVNPTSRQLFDKAIEKLEGIKLSEFKKEDSDSKLSDLTLEELQSIKADLSKRKYNFQYKSNIPDDHTKFMEELQKEIVKMIINDKGN